MRSRISLLVILAVYLVGTASAQTYSFKTVYDFKGTDPALPSFLIQDTKGNVYGTSSKGGKFNQGAVFQITSKGVLRNLHSFNGTTDGSGPNSLVRDAKTGTLYGTTDTTIFKLTTGLLLHPRAESATFKQSAGMSFWKINRRLDSVLELSSIHFGRVYAAKNSDVDYRSCHLSTIT